MTRIETKGDTVWDSMGEYLAYCDDDRGTGYLKLDNSNYFMLKAEGVRFQDSSITNANFGYANLKGANLSRAKVLGSNFSGANLENAELEATDFQGSDLRNANFKGADLWAANLKNAFLDRAIMPDGRTIEEWEKDPLKGIFGEGLCKIDGDPDGYCDTRALANEAWNVSSWNGGPLQVLSGFEKFDDWIADISRNFSSEKTVQITNNISAFLALKAAYRLNNLPSFESKLIVIAGDNPDQLKLGFDIEEKIGIGKVVDDILKWGTKEPCPYSFKSSNLPFEAEIRDGRYYYINDVLWNKEEWLFMFWLRITSFYTEKKPESFGKWKEEALACLGGIPVEHFAGLHNDISSLNISSSLLPLMEKVVKLIMKDGLDPKLIDLIKKIKDCQFYCQELKGDKKEWHQYNPWNVSFINKTINGKQFSQDDFNRQMWEFWGWLAPKSKIKGKDLETWRNELHKLTGDEGSSIDILSIKDNESYQKCLNRVIEWVCCGNNRELALQVWRELRSFPEIFAAHKDVSKRESYKKLGTLISANVIWAMKRNPGYVNVFSDPSYGKFEDFFKNKKIDPKFFQVSSFRNIEQMNRVLVWADTKPDLFHDMCYQMASFFARKEIVTEDFTELNQAILTLIVPPITERTKEIEAQAVKKGLSWAYQELLALYDEALDYPLERGMLEKLLTLLYGSMDEFKNFNVLEKFKTMIFKLTKRLNTDSQTYPTLFKINQKLEDFFYQDINDVITQESRRLSKDLLLPHNILFNGSNLKKLYETEIQADKAANQYVEGITELTILQNFAETEAQTTPTDTLAYLEQLLQMVNARLKTHKDSQSLSVLSKEIADNLEKFKIISFAYVSKSRDEEIEIRLNMILDILMEPEKEISDATYRALHQLVKTHQDNANLAHICQKLLEKLPVEPEVSKPSVVSKVATRIATSKISNIIAQRLYPNASPMVKSMLDMAAGAALGTSDNQTVQAIAKELRVSSTVSVFSDLLNHVSGHLKEIDLKVPEEKEVVKDEQDRIIEVVQTQGESFLQG